jgi:hypothetical protein
MADISKEIADIELAARGEEVRDSIWFIIVSTPVFLPAEKQLVLQSTSCTTQRTICGIR